MGDPDRLDTPDRDESDVASGGPEDEPEPYRPLLTDEEREELRREWLAAVRPPVGAR